MTITDEMARIEAEVRRCEVNKAGRRKIPRNLKRRAVVEFSKLDFNQKEFCELVGICQGNFGKWVRAFQPSIKREMKSTTIPPHSTDTMTYNMVSPVEKLLTDPEVKMARIMAIAKTIAGHETSIVKLKRELKELV